MTNIFKSSATLFNQPMIIYWDIGICTGCLGFNLLCECFEDRSSSIQFGRRGNICWPDAYQQMAVTGFLFGRGRGEAVAMWKGGGAARACQSQSSPRNESPLLLPTSQLPRSNSPDQNHFCSNRSISKGDWYTSRWTSISSQINASGTLLLAPSNPIQYTFYTTVLHPSEQVCPYVRLNCIESPTLALQNWRKLRQY